MRLINTFILAMSLLTPLAWACEMSSSDRAAALPAYVEAGEACLETPPGAFRFDHALEAGFLREINRERRTRSLPALKLRAAMRPAARFHSLDMGVNAFFSHDAPDKRTHVERLAAFDRTLLANGSAENIAQFGPAICYDQDQVEVPCATAPGFKGPGLSLVLNDLHAKLMASEGHRRNMLDPKMTHAAIGVARTETGFYVTQVFAEVSGSLSEPAPLQLEAGAALTLTAKVPGWSVANLAVFHTGETYDLERARLPSDLSGLAALSVRAETVETFREGAVTRTVTSWIYPSGPLIEIIPAKGS